MKNFVLADSCELMAVRLISACWAQKRLISNFYTCPGSSSWKIFFSSIRASWYLLDSFLPPEPKNVWFQVFTHVLVRVHEKFSSRRFGELRLMAVRLLSACWAQKRLILEFMKNFLLADSSMMAVRLISASWAQKRLIPFHTWVHEKFSSRRFERGLLDSFRPPEPKNVRASWWLLDSFRPPEPKNVWFQLSTNDVRRVHEKFSSRRFEPADGC